MMNSRVLDWLQLRSDRNALERFKADEHSPNNTKRMKDLCEAGLLMIKYEHRMKIGSAGGTSRVGYEITELGQELLDMEIPNL